MPSPATLSPRLGVRTSPTGEAATSGQHQPVKRMWPAGRRSLLPPRVPRRGGGPGGGSGALPRLRRLRWQLLALLAGAVALVAYDRTLDRSQDVFRPPELDVLGVAVKPSCVNRAAIRALNRHVQPRVIHVVSGTLQQCAIFQGFALNVRCHLEDVLLPGVTKASVAERLRQRFGAAGDSLHGGRRLAGWYLQQFLKLGAAVYLPSLSRYYLLWDMDMIVLRRPRLWVTPPRRVGASEPRRAVVNIGGARERGYELSYRALFGADLRSAPDGSSFVTHWVVVYKPHAVQFLDAIGNATVPTTWAWRILDSVDPAYINQGFSEYASYVSWVQQHHPQSQAIAHRRNWLRQGLGGEAAVRLLRPLSPGRLCCPWPAHLWLTRLLGYTYTGYEVGHVQECRYSDPQHAESYGV